MKDVYQVLNELGIDYTENKHEAVFTVEEADRVNKNIPGAHTKNLFLRDKKGRHHLLLVCPAHKTINLKEVGIKIGIKNLSFASPARLKKYLGLTPGSVTPLGLINDKENIVEVVIDKKLLESNLINVHPNHNKATLTIGMQDFKKFLESSSHDIRFVTI
jgi:Ala-tRNA(Pro) deacylase